MILRWNLPPARLGVLVGALVVLLSTSAIATAQEPDLAKLEKQFQPLAKTAADQLTNEKQLQETLRGLQALDAQIKKLIPDDAGDETDAPIVKLHSDIVRAISTARARLPVEPLDGGGRNTPLLAPSYPPDCVVGKATARFRAAQAKLAAALGDAPGSEKVQDALAELILAQENLAWEVGWPFTEAEAKAVREAKGLSYRVYSQRRNRGLKTINRHLNRETAGVGRDDRGPFEIFRSDDKETQQKVQDRLAEVRGKEVAADWATGTRPVDEKVLIQLLRVR